MADILDLPRLYTESEAAERLNTTGFTLARERKAGRIRYRRLRGGIRYTAADLKAYVDSILVVPTCESAQPDSKLADIGSASDRTARPGAGRGSIRKLDRRAAHLLAQATLKQRSSS